MGVTYNASGLIFHIYFTFHPTLPLADIIQLHGFKYCLQTRSGLSSELQTRVSKCLLYPLGCLTVLSKLRVPTLNFLLPLPHNLAHSNLSPLKKIQLCPFSSSSKTFGVMLDSSLCLIHCIQSISQSQCFYLQNRSTPCPINPSCSGPSHCHLLS